MSRARLGILSVAVAVSMAASALGCSQNIMNFDVLSSSAVVAEPEADTTTHTVRGSDSSWMLLIFNLRSIDIQSAVDKAIESAGSEYDALVNGTVHVKTWWIILTGRQTFEVVGTPVKSAEYFASSEDAGESSPAMLYNLLYHSSEGKSNASAMQNLDVVHIE